MFHFHSVMHFRDCGPSVTQLHTSRIVCPQPHVFGQSRNGSTLMFRPTRILCKATALSPELLKSHLPQKWFSELARRPRVGMLLSATCKRIRSLTVKKKKASPSAAESTQWLSPHCVVACGNHHTRAKLHLSRLSSSTMVYGLAVGTKLYKSQISWIN
jgi:hypothetical protein